MAAEQGGERVLHDILGGGGRTGHQGGERDESAVLALEGLDEPGRWVHGGVLLMGPYDAAAV